MIVDVLSRMMKVHVIIGRIKELRPKRGCLEIHHLFFVDDSLFFIRGLTKNEKNMREIIENYCSTSGQKVKFSKSSVFFNSDVDELQTGGDSCFLSATNFEPGIVPRPPYYLGQIKEGNVKLPQGKNKGQNAKMEKSTLE